MENIFSKREDSTNSPMTLGNCSGGMTCKETPTLITSFNLWKDINKLFNTKPPSCMHTNAQDYIPIVSMSFEIELNWKEV